MFCRFKFCICIQKTMFYKKKKKKKSILNYKVIELHVNYMDPLGSLLMTVPLFQFINCRGRSNKVTITTKKNSIVQRVFMIGTC